MTIKRLTLAVVLIFGIAFVQMPKVFAADYYVGTMGNFNYYLVTETIKELRHYSDGGRFAAQIKMVGQRIQYIDYELEIGTSGVMYQNSPGNSGEVTPQRTPIEWTMSQYIAKNYLWR